MSATTLGSLGSTVLIQGKPKLADRISLQSILVGTVISLAVGFMLNLLGVAVRATSLNLAMPGQSPTAQTLTISSAVWFLVSSLIGLGVGGYAAARLSGNADGADSALHGLAVWGMAFLIAGALAGSTAIGAASSVAQSTGSAVGGLAQGLGSAGSAAGAAIDPNAAMERARSALVRRDDPQQMSSEQRLAEIGTIAARRLAAGSYETGAKDRLQALIAAEADITPAEAGQRIDQAEAQARQAAQSAVAQARAAADTAAKGISMAAFSAFAMLLLGAIAAALGARAGARHATTLRGASLHDAAGR